MKSNYTLAFFLFLSFMSCKPKDTTATVENTTPAPDTTASAADREIPGIKQMWTTEKVLTTSECVLYDKTNNVLYVSCINGAPNKKDGDGFIAQVGLDGKILKEKWITGLDTPRGMGIAGTTLYVTDIDRLVSFDIATGKMIKEWKVKGSSYLNDVAVANDGTVYFSDSNTSSIYALRGGTTVETVMDADVTLGYVNGLYVNGNSLMLTGMKSGEVYSLDIATHNVQKVAEGIGAGDGVEKYKNGWLVSNWNGEVWYISSNGETTEVLDSQEAKLNSADIEVIEEKNMLLVPTFFGNTVSAYELVQN